MSDVNFSQWCREFQVFPNWFRGDKTLETYWTYRGLLCGIRVALNRGHFLPKERYVTLFQSSHYFNIYKSTGVTIWHPPVVEYESPWYTRLCSENGRWNHRKSSKLRSGGDIFIACLFVWNAKSMHFFFFGLRVAFDITFPRKMFLLSYSSNVSITYTRVCPSVTLHSWHCSNVMATFGAIRVASAASQIMNQSRIIMRFPSFFVFVYAVDWPTRTFPT